MFSRLNGSRCSVLTKIKFNAFSIIQRNWVC
jgi:hypothetical protein